MEKQQHTDQAVVRASRPGAPRIADPWYKNPAILERVVRAGDLEIMGFGIVETMRLMNLPYETVRQDRAKARRLRRSKVTPEAMADKRERSIAQLRLVQQDCWRRLRPMVGVEEDLESYLAANRATMLEDRAEDDCEDGEYEGRTRGEHDEARRRTTPRGVESDDWGAELASGRLRLVRQRTMEPTATAASMLLSQIVAAEREIARLEGTNRPEVMQHEFNRNEHIEVVHSLAERLFGFVAQGPGGAVPGHALGDGGQGGPVPLALLGEGQPGGAEGELDDMAVHGREGGGEDQDGG